MYKASTVFAPIMIEYLIAICLLLLTLGHGILIHGCMTWTKERRATTAGLEDKLATLATLIDEGLDLLSEATGDGPANAIAQPVFDLKQTLLAGLLSKMNMGEDHGTQEERQISEEENDTPQEKTEV